MTLLYYLRAKSCVLVYVAYDMVLASVMRRAASLGLTVLFNFHKVTALMVSQNITFLLVPE